MFNWSEVEVDVIIWAVESSKSFETLVLNAKQSSLDIESQEFPFPWPGVKASPDLVVPRFLNANCMRRMRRVSLREGTRLYRRH
jgi:hypothetical protein